MKSSNRMPLKFAIMLESTLLDVHMLTSSISTMYSSMKEYARPLSTVCERTDIPTKNAPFKSLAYYNTLLKKLQEAAGPKEQPYVYTNSQHESHSRQSNRRLGKIRNTRSSSNT